MRNDFIRKNMVRQIISLKQSFAQKGGMLFDKILSFEDLMETLKKGGKRYRNRIYSPIVTLQYFLFQTMSVDHSCQEMVSQKMAELLKEGSGECSSNTASYCVARKKLSGKWVMGLMQQTGNKLHEKSLKLWRGRSVKLIDGTTVSMPDTAANQKKYPQVKKQEAGIGFPIARMVGIISLSCGAVLDIAIGSCEGKGTGEHGLLRRILSNLKKNDVVIGDRYYCSYWLIAALMAQGVDCVFQQHAMRSSDFRRGKQLGTRDHLIILEKPRQKPAWMSKKTYDEMPDEITVREIKVKGKILITTFLKPKEVSKKEIGDLYKQRWLIEVDLRAIKIVLQMDILRCKTPKMVNKEIAVHLLGYNLIRAVMAESAYRWQMFPREISFKATVQLLNAFREKGLLANERDSEEIYQSLFKAIAQHRVMDRPGRIEPRVVKRRPKKRVFMMQPRTILRQRLLRKVCLN